jgi:predicted aldo/keto reductase-like oxidoreductase
VGFSTHADTAVILTAIDSGRFDYVNVHAHFLGNYTAVDNWPCVRAAAARGMGVFIISPTHQVG